MCIRLSYAQSDPFLIYDLKPGYTTGVPGGTATAHPFGTPEFTPGMTILYSPFNNLQKNYMCGLLDIYMIPDAPLSNDFCHQQMFGFPIFQF